MKNIHKFLFIILASLAFLPSQAQSPEFALYHLTPVLNNPAMLGSDNKAHIFYNFRNQPVVNGENLGTHIFTANTPIAVGKSGNHFTLGGSFFLTEQVQFMQNFGAIVTLNYNLKITNKSFLGLGIQGGAFQRSINLSGESTNSQFINGTFNRSASLVESLDGSRKSYFNSDVGLFWHGVNDNNEQKFFLGLSMQNITQPDIAFVNDSEDNLPLRWTVVGGYQFDLSERFALMPNIRWVEEAGNNQANIGSWLQYKTGSEQYPNYWGNLRLGTWYNTNESISLSLEFMKSFYGFAIGYIIAFSDEIEPTQADGVFEISAGFKIGKKNDF